MSLPLAAAAILAWGAYRAYSNTVVTSSKNNDFEKKPTVAVGGEYGTAIGVDPGNNLEYIRDNTKVCEVGYDIYGIPYTDIYQTDGSKRRTFGANTWQLYI